MVDCGIGATSNPLARTPRRHLGRRAFVGSLVVIAVLTAFGFAALRANYQQNRTEAIKGVERTARLAGALGESLITLAQQEIGVLSRSAAFVDGDVAAIQRAIDLSSPRGLGFGGGMAWMDSFGQERARWVGPPPSGDIDFTTVDAVRRAFTGMPTIESLPSEGGSSIRPIVFATPTFGPLGQITGVLAGAVTLDSSSGEVVNSLFGTDALLAIDSEGRQVLGSEQVTDRNVVTAESTLRRLEAQEDGRDEPADGAGDAPTPFLSGAGNGVFADVNDSVVGWANVRAAQWLIVVERPRSELFAPFRWQFERSLFALGLLFVMSVVGAAVASWRLDRVHRRESESRQLFQTVLQQLPVGVAVVDKAGRIVVTNDRTDTALGARAEPGHDAPEPLRAASEAMNRRDVVLDLDVQVGNPDDAASGDGRRTLVVRAAPVESAGQVTGAAAIVEDVTELRQREERSSRLAEASAGLASATSREEVAAVVVADGVRAFGARAAMVMLRDPLRPDRLVLASTSGFGEGVTDGWESMSLASATPVAEATRTGASVFVTLDDAAERFPDMGDLFASSGNEAWAALPLRSAGRIDGALGISFRHADDIGGPVRSQLIGFAAEVSQALDRASRQSIEHDVALVLQQGLLQPAGGDELTDIEVASRYVPAEDHLEVGGDFFDVLQLEDGSVMLVIGDVVGHGLEAASAMGQIRSAVRAVSATTTSPARVLELLDKFATVVPACRFSTAAIVLIGADRRSLRYSVAGHPSPALVTVSGRTTLLDGALSRPIGVYPDHRPEAEVEVTAGGTTVCLYTDGLIERRDEVIDVGIDLLTSTLARHHDEGCESLADRLLGEVGGPGVQRDDIAVLCARF